MQLDWLAGGNQIGEIAAVQLGYFAEEGVRAFGEKRAPVFDGAPIHGLPRPRRLGVIR